MLGGRAMSPGLMNYGLWAWLGQTQTPQLLTCQDAVQHGTRCKEVRRV